MERGHFCEDIAGFQTEKRQWSLKTVTCCNSSGIKSQKTLIVKMSLVAELGKGLRCLIKQTNKHTNKTQAPQRSDLLVSFLGFVEGC